MTAPDFLSAALAIGQSLHEQARVDPGGGPTWWGDELVGLDPAAIPVQRIDTGPWLYGGAAGIGGFLCHLGAATGAVALCQLGRQALQGALEAAHAARGDTDPRLSLYGGASGVALAAWQAGGRLGDERLAARALQLGERVARDVLRAPVRGYDLIGGAAGIAVALAALHRAQPRPVFVRACARLGQALLRSVRREGPFASWPDPQAPVDPPAGPDLCGLAHGTSGIAWGLLGIADVTAETRFAVAARSALAYERSWFVPERGMWPDLRHLGVDGQPAAMTAWCHGAIGIAALRLRLLRRAPGDPDWPRWSAEAGAGLHGSRAVVVAAQQAHAAGQPFDVTLCHGLGGAADLYTLAFECTGAVEHRRAAARTAGLCLAVRQVTGGRLTCGVPGGQQAPGLMVGEAGVGAMLLRLHDPGAMPSPLLPG